MEFIFVFWCIYNLLDVSRCISSFLQLMAEERGLSVDVEGFNNAMEEARERSRSAQNKVSGFCFVLSLI